MAELTSEERSLGKINDDYAQRYGFADTEKPIYRAPEGVSRELIEQISREKQEPQWMLDFRLKALDHFQARPMPTWGPDLSAIDFEEVSYYIRPVEKQANSWEEVPDDMKTTFDRLGISEKEQELLAGVSLQYDSESIYHQMRTDLEEQGVIFLDTDTALREHPDLVRRWFATAIPSNDNKFAALNSAFWSGGSTIYVPPDVEVTMPLQAYFRINSRAMLQAERTLIIADEGSKVVYVEGCSAPSYSAVDSLHAAVVEIVALPGSDVTYFTFQNWDPRTVYNMVTKRAMAYENATVRWIQCELGCLTGDTRIMTDKGPVPIQNITVGDNVYSCDLASCSSVLKPVTAFQRMGRKEVFLLQTEDYREIKATANHPFLCLKEPGSRRPYVLEWKPVEELGPGDRIATACGLPDLGKPKDLTMFVAPNKKSQNPITLPKETTEELMWLLGVYIGDGCMERQKNGNLSRVNFAVPPFDRARARLEKTLKDVFAARWQKRGPYSIGVGSRNFAEFILWLGFGGRASEKRVPGWIWELPLSQQRAFIEGYLDSDGHERGSQVKDGVQYGQVVFASVNKELLGDIKLLLNSVGIRAGKVVKYSSVRKLSLGKETKEYTTYFLNANIRDALPILRGEKPPADRIEFVRVRDIQPCGVEETFDIEVEETHNFLAENIFVHNSKLNMKYPSVYLLGENAHAEILSVAMAGPGQNQDTGGKVIHAAPKTTSTITSKSISHGGGIASYRGLLEVADGASECRSRVVCDALLLDDRSASNTWPTIRIDDPTADVGHEATVSKVGDEQLFYLQSRGLEQAEAEAMIVNGFIEPIIKEVPMEYAVEMNRLIQLKMEGSIG